MSLPALHLRNQQAVVKMVEAKGLSLRGGRRPTWQSREGTAGMGKASPTVYAARFDCSGAQ